MPREKLESFLNDTARKLKATRKELANVIAERDGLAAQQEKAGAKQGEATALDDLKAELQVRLSAAL